MSALMSLCCVPSFLLWLLFLSGRKLSLGDGSLDPLPPPPLLTRIKVPVKYYYSMTSPNR